MTDFSALLGQTLVRAEVVKEGEEVVFVTDQGDVFTQYHNQDGCENVSVEDVAGDLSDIVGSPILLAEEVTYEGETPEGVDLPGHDDSYTWTFYKLSTIKGSVTIRWFGSSNGYYSESVAFHKEG